MTTLEEIQKRREARRQAHMAAFEAQRLADTERLDALEEQHGYSRIHPVKLEAKVWQAGEGAATMLILKLPRGSEHVYKRFIQKANAKDASAVNRIAANDELAMSCIAYPHPVDDSDTYKATLDIAPGILGHAAKVIVEHVQGEADEEGK